MRKTFYFLFLIFISLNGQNISSWQNHTNMENVSSVLFKNNELWAGTNGGVFRFLESDSSYQKLTKSEGLSGQTITAISIDNNNKIWIGTIEGYINVYDPSLNQIKTILEINKTNKNLKSINDITIRDDTAFVSTDFGLSLINTNNLSFYDSVLKFGNFVAETPVQNVYLGSTIYVVTNSGIAVKKSSTQNLSAPESWDNINLNLQIPADKIYKIIEYQNHLFAATNKGLIKQTDNVWQTILYRGFDIFDLLIVDNNLYSLLANTIHKYDNISDEVIFNMSSTIFNDFEINNGIFYIASNRGIIKSDLQNSQLLFPNSPGSNAIINIDVDSQGNLWSASGKDGKGKGVFKYDGEFWETLSTEKVPEFKTNDFHKVSASNNSVYFSNWGRGFVRLKDDTIKQFDADNTEINGITDHPTFIVIDDVIEDSKGDTWILNFWSGNKEPLSVLTADGQWNHYQMGSPLSADVVLAENLVVDQYFTKWFGVTGLGIEGLYYFNENNTFENKSDDIWGRITTSNGLRDKDINALALDQFGEVIIGTSIGVDVIPDPSNPSSIRSDQYFAIRQQTINCIAVDPINQKWFGTTKGVFLMSPDGSRLIANYNSSNSTLPNDDIKSLAIDEKKGIIYVGTDFGLTEITTLFVKPNSDFSQLFVYPNPITIDENINPNVIIDGLVEDSEIKILDISGNLINEFITIGGRTTYWNLKDLDNNFVASGVYIIVAFDSEANQVSQTKIAVIKK
ncbi:MAG: T9SS type A sorting domain-containing protein [Ignavibacteriae bacterium]|nr:T9SS type A sorting domain-containing protein [Ignavibacteriota bacterium]